jgi:hypothetical protein
MASKTQRLQRETRCDSDYPVRGRDQDPDVNDQQEGWLDLSTYNSKINTSSRGIICPPRDTLGIPNFTPSLICQTFPSPFPECWLYNSSEPYLSDLWMSICANLAKNIPIHPRQLGSQKEGRFEAEWSCISALEICKAAVKSNLHYIGSSQKKYLVQQNEGPTWTPGKVVAKVDGSAGLLRPSHVRDWPVP